MNIDETDLKPNPIVTLSVTNGTGTIHLVQVGGYTLATLFKELSSIEDIPLERQLSQLDLVGQDIYVTRDHKFFNSLKGSFTHISWASTCALPCFSKLEAVVYSFVVSY